MRNSEVVPRQRLWHKSVWGPPRRTGVVRGTGGKSGAGLGCRLAFWIDDVPADRKRGGKLQILSSPVAERFRSSGLQCRASRFDTLQQLIVMARQPAGNNQMPEATTSDVLGALDLPAVPLGLPAAASPSWPALLWRKCPLPCCPCSVAGTWKPVAPVSRPGDQ